MERKGLISILIRSIFIMLIAAAVTLALTKDKGSQATSASTVSVCNGCPKMKGCGLPQKAKQNSNPGECRSSSKGEDHHE